MAACEPVLGTGTEEREKREKKLARARHCPHSPVLCLFHPARHQPLRFLIPPHIALRSPP